MTRSASKSRRPYLLRAMHEWMSDNSQTPHIVVDATIADVEVPPQHIRDGKIILNISHAATNALRLANDYIEFEARFSGRRHRVRIPLGAVLGIYARETGQGMIFTEDDLSPDPPAPASGEGARGPHLKVVK